MSPGGVPLTAPESSSSAERARVARSSMEAFAGNLDVFETFFDHARIGLALADLSGRYLRVNASYADLIGRAVEDLVGVSLADVLRDADGEPLEVGALLAAGRSSFQSEQSYVHPDSSVLWVLHGVAAVRGSDGAAGWYSVSAQDITERRHAEQDLRQLTAELSEQAVRDPLTGLANRALLGERLCGALARDARTGGSTGVMFLDLDGFKEVNDRHGHATGDAVLRGVADRLRAGVRPSDTVARVGGDEFVILVEDATDAGLEALSTRLQTAVCIPIEGGGRTLNVGVSVGVARATRGTVEAQELLSQADARMYDAKRAAR